MSTTNKKSVSNTKKFQLNVPDSSPEDSPAKLPFADSNNLNVGSSLEFTKHLASGKKESLESLKKHHMEKKLQRQDRLENGEGSPERAGGVFEEQTNTTTTYNNKRHNGKTPYEILFDQNQNLAHELEVSGDFSQWRCVLSYKKNYFHIKVACNSLVLILI